jgi:hypothetical protein
MAPRVREQIGASFVYVMLMSLAQCRAQEPTPAPTPAPAATVVPVASTTPQETPMPTPTPTLDPPRPLELVVPTAVPPLMETPTPTPLAGLPMDSRLAEDEKRLVSLSAIVQDADELDALFQDYVSTCFVTFLGQKWQAPSGREAAEGRPWFTLLDPQPTVHWREPIYEKQPSDAVVHDIEHCRDMWDELTRRPPLLAPRVDALSEEARRAGVLPGNLRTLLKKHRLVR